MHALCCPTVVSDPEQRGTIRAGDEHQLQVRCIQAALGGMARAALQPSQGAPAAECGDTEGQPAEAPESVQVATVDSFQACALHLVQRLVSCRAILLRASKLCVARFI